MPAWEDAKDRDDKELRMAVYAAQIDRLDRPEVLLQVIAKQQVRGLECSGEARAQLRGGARDRELGERAQDEARGGHTAVFSVHLGWWDHAAVCGW